MQQEKKIDELLERLRGELDIERLIEEMDAIPQAIKREQLGMQTVKAQMPEVESKIKEIEAELSFVIANETNGGEKPKAKFSNETLRRGELTKRLKVHKEHIEAQTRLRELQVQEQNHQIDMDRLRRQLQVNLAIKDLIVAEINLYAGIGGIIDAEQKESKKS